MTDAESLVSGIAAGIGNAPALHELDEDETARLKIGYMKSKGWGTEGVTISFHFGDGTANTVQEVADIVEPRLDKRKFRVSTDQPKYKQNKSWDIGWVDIDTNGEIVGYELNSEYLKPTEQ